MKNSVMRLMQSCCVSCQHLQQQFLHLSSIASTLAIHLYLVSVLASWAFLKPLLPLTAAVVSANAQDNVVAPMATDSLSISSLGWEWRHNMCMQEVSVGLETF